MTTATRKAPAKSAPAPAANGKAPSGLPEGFDLAPVSATARTSTGPVFNPKILSALDYSYDNREYLIANGQSLSVPLADLPEGRENILDENGKNTGQTRKLRSEKTADSYLRRHAAHRGYGISVRLDEETGKVFFQATDKKIVASGTARAKRGSTAEEKAALKAQREANK